MEQLSRAALLLLLVLVACVMAAPSRPSHYPVPNVSNTRAVSFRGFMLFTGESVEKEELTLLNQLFPSLPSVLGGSSNAQTDQSVEKVGWSFLATLTKEQREEVVSLCQKLAPKVAAAITERTWLLDYVKAGIHKGHHVDDGVVRTRAALLLEQESELQLLIVDAMIPLYHALTQDQLDRLNANRQEETPRLLAKEEQDAILNLFSHPAARKLLLNLSAEISFWFTGGGMEGAALISRPASFLEPIKVSEHMQSTISEMFLGSLTPHARAILKRAAGLRVKQSKRFEKLQSELTQHFQGLLKRVSVKQALQDPESYPAKRYAELAQLNSEIASLESATYISLRCAMGDRVIMDCLTERRAFFLSRGESISKSEVRDDLFCLPHPALNRVGVKPNYLLSGEELVFPEERSSVEGSLSTLLHLDVHVYENPLVTFTTRAYEASIPGPTLRFRRGEVLHVIVENDLGPQFPVGNVTHNTLNLPNSTNLHTHGLHISGDDPGDSIFVEIHPGEKHEYLHELHLDHAGGTFWYHPHRHGSTYVQVGGLAAGAMIVEDEEGDIPDIIATMPEVICVLQHAKFTGSNKPQDAGLTSNPPDEVWKQDLKGYIPGENDADYNFLLINGQYKPKYTMPVGEWHRFRLIFAGHSQHLILNVSDSNCEMQLIAKDGVYVFDAPRPIKRAILAPGNRADVAIRCNVAGTYTVRSVGTNPLAGLTDELVGEFFTLNVESTSPACHASVHSRNINAQVPPMEKFKAYRPDYLRDLTYLDSAAIPNKFSVSLSGGSGGLGVNGKPFEPPPYYTTTIPVGDVHEWTLTGYAVHPFHLHVNPFQIAGPENIDDGDYWKIGDFHDTLKIVGGPSSAILRFQTDVFVGDMVLHCHILGHEDSGMMACVNITGEEGGVWIPTEEQQPPCVYDLHYGEPGSDLPANTPNSWLSFGFRMNWPVLIFPILVLIALAVRIYFHRKKPQIIIAKLAQ